MTDIASIIAQHSDEVWEGIVPVLEEYIAIPNVSMVFDPEWRAHGHMAEAVDLIASWCRARTIPGLTVEVVELDGRTPVILIEAPAVGAGSNSDTVLLYGHLDKQPEMEGWREGLGPWTPVLDGDRLYGRGGADDGYSAFAALTAIEAVHIAGGSHARCVVLIEASEESGSPDLPAYVEALADRIGTPSLVVCLDSGCIDYDRLWVTTSLRGLVSGTLTVDIVTDGLHSGDVGGMVPDTFRIARALLDRVEDVATGALLVPELNAAIPADRVAEAAATAAEIGRIGDHYPFVPGASPTTDDPAEQLLARHVAVQPHRGWRGRPATDRPRRQRAASADVAEAVLSDTADLRSVTRRGGGQEGARIRSSVRRTGVVRRRRVRAGMERAADSTVAGGCARRRVDRRVRSTGANVRGGRVDPLYGNARREVPRCAVRDHRRARTRCQRAWTQRVPPSPDRSTGHDGRCAPPRRARRSLTARSASVSRVTVRWSRLPLFRRSSHVPVAAA